MKYILKIFPREFLIKFSFYLLPVLKILFRGKKFKDPIDGNGYSTFFSYGYKKIRKNALCPGTLSLERHRILWLYLTNETNIFESNLRVLHIAPEQIFFKRFRKIKNWDYVTFDLKSPLASVKGDIKSMNFKDDYFDLIICNHVLEHIDDDFKALKEIYRVLKPGGISILQVPMNINRVNTIEDRTVTSKKEREKLYGQYDHVREYGLDFKERVEKIGFEIELIDYVKNFSSDIIEKYSLKKDDFIPIARKLVSN